MKVLLSWSGNESKMLAEALRSWLPSVIQALEPWVSSHDISKGDRWLTQLGQQLETNDFGIVCLTPSNLSAEWILFEAGAISKVVESSHVCPLLWNLTPSDLQGPLSLFQATIWDKKEILSLLKSLNSALGDSALDDDRLLKNFEKWWPDLEASVASIEETERTIQPRDDRDILEEVLSTVRGLARTSARLEPRQKVETRTERILVRPAHTEWVAGRGSDERLNPETGEYEIMVEVPATYRTRTVRIVAEDTDD